MHKANFWFKLQTQPLKKAFKELGLLLKPWQSTIYTNFQNEVIKHNNIFWRAKLLEYYLFVKPKIR